MIWPNKSKKMLTQAPNNLSELVSPYQSFPERYIHKKKLIRRKTEDKQEKSKQTSYALNSKIYEQNSNNESSRII